MKKALLLGIIAVIAGCGPDPAPPASFVFAGRWSGDMLYNGKMPFRRSAILDMAIGSKIVEVRALCPDATGIVVAQASGATASWTGDLACPFPSSTCPDQTIHYGSLSLQLVAENAINITGVGAITACHESSNITIVFQGTK